MNRNVRLFGWVAGLAALGVTLTLALAACAGANPGLAGTQWNLAALNGQAPLAGADRLTLGFESEARFGGNSGCNVFGGNYTLTGSALKLSDINSTLRACADQSLNDQEAQYYAALNAVATYEITGGQLILKDANSRTVLAFDRA